MVETLDLSCPRGCFDLEASGSHETRDDQEFLEDVALDDGAQQCPNCGGHIRTLQHLDGPRCVFCGVPVSEDERNVRTDYFGSMRRFHICKGHSEHPQSFIVQSEHPTDYRICPRCERVTRIRDGGLCLGCSTYQREGSVPEYFSGEAALKIAEAGGCDE